jgi:hypothetical protein
MHGFLRWIVTALYVVSLLFELLSAANAYADIALLPLVVLALTASYGILYAVALAL